MSRGRPSRCRSPSTRPPPRASRRRRIRRPDPPRPRPPTGAAVESTDDGGETAINAETPTTGAPAEAAPAAPADPATGELNAEEASILAVLAQDGRIDEDRTAIAVATSLERETTDVSAVLRKLGSEGVVSGELYTATGDKIWAVTERGVRRLGAQH